MQFSNLSFRLAQTVDLKDINCIYNQSVPSRCSVADLDEWDMSRRKIWFDHHHPKDYPIYVCLLKDEIIGWFSFSAYRPQKRALAQVAEVSYFIKSDFHGQKLGTHMMEFILQIAPSHNKKHLIAILLDKNAASIKLLTKFNFKEWGRMPSILNFEGEICDHLYYGLSLD
ncbi:MAG: GNAT family N-acetyltransferase [Bacteroidetes bacterium]|jgi:L-amino acid N-acyltransferase YncA|nr:GNAT family N-acetyltransferase [Bacteroidota bacterium]MBT3799519.1 GNAT family N-acetyltransferase [Bacteroidota bacterium]MBT4338628.1 GNAT family N-acetyltransferase [Bacteroidota bacterium]MBT4727675.1 GNAT family N-acetyltransferase [Bacteroidota bacterium]MBT5531078.1 GNAT family N-acetyltransferase [Cytophagia bacterium]